LRVPDRLVAACVEPITGWGKLTARALVATLRDALGAELRVEIRLAERIPQEPSGKYRFSICRVPV
jgi:hypothetical protein